MSQILHTAPIAFLLYLALAMALGSLGRVLAGVPRPSPIKTSTYASGEAPPGAQAPPGYRGFFVVALFFAVLHLGVLILGSGGLSAIATIYLIGLLLVLVALILG